MNNNWISVNESLPEKDQEAVLVTRKKTESELEKDKEFWPLIMAARTDDNDWYDYNDGERIDGDKWIITHWMALPEPAL